MLLKRMNVGKGFYLFLIVVFLMVGVLAVTVDVWTYYETGAYNPSAPVVTGSFEGSVAMHDFAECDPLVGEYVIGYRLVRDVDSETVNAEVICESRGSDNAFIVNTGFSSATVRSCTSGPDIMQNIAIANFTANSTGGDVVSYECSGDTGCGGGYTGCYDKIGFPKLCTDFTDENKCEDTRDDCRWDDSFDYCDDVVGNSGDCNDDYGSDEDDCDADSECVWVPEACEGNSGETVYDPDCTTRDKKSLCNNRQGCAWGKESCSIYSKSKKQCKDKGCVWGTSIACNEFNTTLQCASYGGDQGDCAWGPTGDANLSFGRGVICPTSSPVMVGVAGYNGEGTEYCRGEEISAGVTYSSLFNEQVAGILPKCASLNNSNCDYRFSTTDCFWYFHDAGTAETCPSGHYVNGVRGFVGDAGGIGRNIYVQSHCCSIESINHSKEGNSGLNDGQDNDCDGIVDEGYFALEITSVNLDENSGEGFSFLDSITKSNETYCVSEGTYYFDTSSPAGSERDDPLRLFTVNYDTDEESCVCRFGNNGWIDNRDGQADTLINGSCCESGTQRDDEDEFIIVGVDSSVSCCNNPVPGATDKTVSIDGECLLTRAYWTNTQGIEIFSTDFRDTLQLRIDNVELAPGTQVVIEILEKDFATSNKIRTEDYRGGIIGVVDGGQNLVANWTIDLDDMTATGDYDKFYFRVKYEDINDMDSAGEYKESGHLEIDKRYGDFPMNLSIVSPECGEDFSVGDNVTIQIKADDDDDFLWGNLTINGYFERSFSNRGVTFNYTFNSPGNYQLLVHAINERGETGRDIANIMIVDTNVDGKYVAACIKTPEDYDNFEESEVEFDASTTRGLVVESGSVSEIFPGNTRLSWYWNFLPEDIIREYINSPDILAYKFNATFPIAGDNSAGLRVELE